MKVGGEEQGRGVGGRRGMEGKETVVDVSSVTENVVAGNAQPVSLQRKVRWPQLSSRANDGLRRWTKFTGWISAATILFFVSSQFLRLSYESDLSTHGQPAAIPFQPQDMDSRRSSVPQNDSAVKDPYSSSSSLPPSAQTAQPPTIPPVEIKVTYCRSDWARFAVAELAQHFPPGFHVQEQPEWDDATILVKSPWGRCSPTAKNVIPIDMENRVHHPRANTIMITTTKNPAKEVVNTLHIPYVFFSLPERKSNRSREIRSLLRGENFDVEKIFATKTRFCGWASRNCHHVNRNSDLALRTHFFDELSKEYKVVDAMGNCRRNRLKPPILSEHKGNDRDEAISYYLDHKFSFAFENSAGPGYITEKILNSYLAHTVPIYWGAPEIEEYFNLESFIHCRPDDITSDRPSNFTTCINHIREVDQDDTKYKKMLAAPPFHGDVIPEWAKWETYTARLVEMLNRTKIVEIPPELLRAATGGH